MKRAATSIGGGKQLLERHSHIDPVPGIESINNFNCEVNLPSSSSPSEGASKAKIAWSLTRHTRRLGKRHGFEPREDSVSATIS